MFINYCVAPYMKEGKCAVATMTYHVIAQLAMNGRGILFCRLLLSQTQLTVLPSLMMKRGLLLSS